MCLYIDFDAVERIAAEDIVVYKVVRCVEINYIADDSVEMKYTSPFKGMEYRIGNTYNSEFSLSSENFHEDELVGELKNLRRSYLSNTVGIVEQGLHTFASYKDAADYLSYRQYKDTYKCAVLRCVIPAGSKYYKGAWVYGVFDVSTTQSYASSKLTVLDEYVEIL